MILIEAPGPKRVTGCGGTMEPELPAVSIFPCYICYVFWIIIFFNFPVSTSTYNNQAYEGLQICKIQEVKLFQYFPGMAGLAQTFASKNATLCWTTSAWYFNIKNIARCIDVGYFLVCKVDVRYGQHSVPKWFVNTWAFSMSSFQPVRSISVFW